MVWHLNPYALVLFICALTTIWVAAYAWRQRALVSAGPALTLLGITIWTLGYAVATGTHDLTGRVFWAKVQHVGIALTCVAVAAFALHYAGREKWLTRRNLILLAAIPSVGLVLAWTNEAHGLIWAHVELQIVDSLALLDITYGPGFWVYFSYTYLVLLGSAAIFLHAAIRSPQHLRRRQATILLVGTLCPGIALAIYLGGLSPLPGLDLAPLSYSLCGLILAWGLFRYRLFDIVPVARDAVIENMIDGVIVLDPQGRIADANPAMLEFIGLPAGQVVGRPIQQVLTGQPDLVERYLDTPEARVQIAVGEGESKRHFGLRISPLYRGQTLTGRVIVLRDITARKQGEEEREQLIGELNAFAHTVAHDLKIPLSAMVGYAELLDEYHDTLPAEEQREYLRTIAWTGRKMSNIVDELMLLANIRQEQAPIRPLDTTQIVAEALKRLEYMIEEYQAEIVQADHWPVALGHASWVEEVWVNYISNAIKYGGQPPRVELGSDIAEDGMIRFWVRDNGQGISAEDQGRLFIPFTRVGQADVRGQGLGLSIVRDIVEKLGGQVGLESTMGQGSLFTFTLPAASRETG